MCGSSITISIQRDDFASTGHGAAGFGYFAALHEVGHALGFSHTFGGSASGAILSSDDDTIRNSDELYPDRPEYVVVASSQLRAHHLKILTVYSSTPMIIDVKAAEHLYGGKRFRWGQHIHIYK